MIGVIIHRQNRRRRETVPEFADRLVIIVVDSGDQTIETLDDLKEVLSVRDDSELNNYLDSAPTNGTFVIDVSDPTFQPVA